jgi:MFS transporter, ACS family, tartrate transporter
MRDDRVFTKCAWRLMPLLFAGFIANYLDRTSAGFAALTMNRDLGFSPSVYGLGAGIFFLSYAMLQIPANLMLDRVGARRWIFFILAGWGAVAAASASIQGVSSLYALRFLLGVFEAGFIPAVLVYLSLWFPKAWLGRVTSVFLSAPTLAVIIGGPLASLILRIDGMWGLRGWQWLFLLEGLPACIIAVAVLKWLPDKPASASWLDPQERAYIASRLQAESIAKTHELLSGLRDPRVWLLGFALAGLLFATQGQTLWLPLIVRGIGFSNATNGFVVALLHIAGVPALILWGRSSDKRCERVWHVAIAAIFAAAALALAGLGTSSLFGPFYAVPGLFLRGPAMAGGVALITTIGGLLGGFAGQYGIGLIREQTGNFGAGFAVTGAALLLSAIIVLALGRSISSALNVQPAPAE